MTVRELIEALSQVNLDLEVMTEGCDCYGYARRLDLERFEDTVVISRGDD